MEILGKERGNVRQCIRGDWKFQVNFVGIFIYFCMRKSPAHPARFQESSIHEHPKVIQSYPKVIQSYHVPDHSCLSQVETIHQQIDGP